MKTSRRKRTTRATRSVLSPAEKALVSELVADGLSIQQKFRPESLYKKTGKGHYESATVDEIRETKKTKSKGHS